MKNAVMLASHIYSGSTNLLRILAENPRIQSYRLGTTYDHPLALSLLTERQHKCSHRGALYVDEILFNHLISCKNILDLCRFIYVVREPRPTLNRAVGNKHMTPVAACRYYCYRLRRLCEMARRTPGAVLLTWDDMVTGRGYPLLEEYLFLKEPLNPSPKLFEDDFEDKNLIGQKELDQANRSYEKYLHYLRNLPLQKTS